MLPAASPLLKYRPVVKSNFIIKASWEKGMRLVLRDVVIKNLPATCVVNDFTHTLQITGYYKTAQKFALGKLFLIKYFNSKNTGQKTMVQFPATHFQYAFSPLHKQ